MVEGGTRAHELLVLRAEELEHWIVVAISEPGQAFVPGCELVLAQTKKFAILAIQHTGERICQLQRAASQEVDFSGVVRVRWNAASHVRFLQSVERATN